MRYITFTPSGGAEEEATLQRFGTFQPLLIFGWFRDYKNLPVPFKINRFKSRASTTTGQTPSAPKHYFNMPGASCCLTLLNRLKCNCRGSLVTMFPNACLHCLQARLLGDCLSLHTASDRYVYHASLAQSTKIQLESLPR